MPGRIRPPGGAERPSGRIRHGSAVHDLEDSIADHRRLLQEELGRAHDVLADGLVAELFEVHRIPPRSVELSTAGQTTVVATKKNRHSRDETGHPGGQPTAGDALASQGSVTDVTYELRVARGNRYGPLEVVYQRKELTTPRTLTLTAS